MNHNMFSIIIPTRQRHDTLKHSIQSVLNQTHTEFEVVVMDNFSSPETAEVAKSFNDSRIKYYRSPKRLSMSDNWELGLSYATGEYVTLLGDDDALMPDGVEICSRLLHEYDVNIVTWSRENTYWWDSAIVPWNRNRLGINFRQVGQILNSRQKLKEYYNFQISWDLMPMLYNSFVHQDIIAKVKSIYGKYFLTYCPDIFSGIVNAYFSDRYFYSSRGLSLGGISGHSTGTSAWFQSFNSEPMQKFSEEFKKNVNELIHESLVPVPNLVLTETTERILTKELFFPEDHELKIDIITLLNCMAANINRDLGKYDVNLQAIEDLAEKYQVPISEINIPPKLVQDPKAYQGPVFNSNGLLDLLLINCEQAGISNVAQAAMLARGILQGLDFLTIYSLTKEQEIALSNELKLREKNLIIFPNWSETEELISQELTAVLKEIATHPDKDRITLLIDTSNISVEDADLVVSGVVMNLLLEQNLDISEGAEISLIGQLNENGWESLLFRISARIVLNYENTEVIARAKAENLPLLELNSLKLQELSI
ncbi:glycosyl transferase family 2 [Crinalium epipsammum PCC 9333]|uniref:Glycosyl transferase family 2 n=1 Tax=Crinalium epipsammum PCC 9333 TaxID=1173022 RepID=K9W1Y8_9CYAN|nr:glycosyltransferase family 2 protein [Crinalium epipsammum]AFZ14226.1 glycosyl transferase family 2 [Crinalium epipsammum PCC 9333]